MRPALTLYLLTLTFLNSDPVVSSALVWPFSWTWSSQNQLSTSVGRGHLVGSPSTHRHPCRRAPRFAHLNRTCSTVSWVSLLLMFWLWGLPGRLQRQSRRVTTRGFSWCVPPIPSPSVSQKVKQKNKKQKTVWSSLSEFQRVNLIRKVKKCRKTGKQSSKTK